MHLLLIFGITLLPQAFTLSCYQCEVGTTCTDQLINCPALSNQCVVHKVTTYAGGSKMTDIEVKSCGVVEQCVNGSINFGISRVTLASKCCNSDGCNKKFTPAASNGNPNGLKCFTCNGENCDATLQCIGSEDHCVSTEVGSVKTALKGCASRQVCEAKDVDELQDALGNTLDCCQGNLCNGARSRSAGLLLLLASLSSLITFT
ncbi:phospholipase A2 inhibitor and Ly6/PLAUR domain-containing protein-like isoform X2 [Echeneis naucrates]|uniref:phospholipase A2 inhibitor and Ly6/PLAUR domain-containing protein-like isoform X2 n=1 Tax=Echeneis naucrates TaxID=173247 RepID=UPI001113EB28|nr:phospholipase A2 inhibitor and Ly6/PLAUR domain-containing protein-like isoform X2 [Echeneis naucrates]